MQQTTDFDFAQIPVLASNASIESLEDDRMNKLSSIQRDFLKNTQERKWCKKLAIKDSKPQKNYKRDNRGYSEFEMQNNASKMHSVSPTNLKRKLELINNAAYVVPKTKLINAPQDSRGPSRKQPYNHHRKVSLNNVQDMMPRMRSPSN